jgi:RNA polymerase sigma factor (sigma-70 family)
LELPATVYHDDLVAKCKQGDAQSYSSLYAKYSKPLFNTSLRIVNNRYDAEDVLQDSFTAAFQFLHDFDYSSTFGAWIKRIVINKSIDVLRRRKFAIVDIDEVALTGMPDSELPDESEVQFKVEEIKKAIVQLPSGYRTVLSLYLFEGYDHEEIAEIMKISHVTVRTQYHRARQKLLSLLQQGGIK